RRGGGRRRRPRPPEQRDGLTMSDQEPARSGSGRLLTGVAWVVLLLGLWLWGRDATDARPGATGPATGDMAAAGRPPMVELPPAHRPLDEALPERLVIPGLDVHAPVVSRGLDARGAL